MSVRAQGGPSVRVENIEMSVLQVRTYIQMTYVYTQIYDLYILVYILNSYTSVHV